MTSAEQKIILDKGSDYRLQLYVKDDNGLSNKDLTGWGWVIKVYAIGNVDTAYKTFSATFDGDFSGDDLANGRCTVHINSVDTGSMVTGIPAEEDPFSTQYNYYYTLTLTGPESVDQLDTVREMRVLRGKMAVRV
jgi:hypothetical protein